MPKIQTPEMRPNPMKTGLAASSHHHFYPHKSAKTPFLNQGRDGITELTDELRSLGIEMSDESAA